MVDLIITEKPSSAKKVAEALADGKPIQKKSKQSSYYELSHNGKDIIVTSAVGHLFGLVEKNKGKWTYPVYDIEWQESYKSSKDLKYVKDYIDTIRDLSKKADSFTIACDYDVEGEVIGYNVVRFVCKQKDASRMKFSTLTKQDLIDSYAQRMNHIDWGQANAGETRHMLDWYYGINVSRALTASVKAAGSFKILSAGRVQGPTLKLLVDREREISSFKPEPYSQIKLIGEAKKEKIEAEHQADRIFDSKETKRIMAKIKDQKTGTIKDLKKTKREQSPPVPFDLTTLQSESYNQFKITPKETLEIAQSLYLAGITSYPRTSSQQLDPKLGFKAILTNISKQSIYSELAKELLKLKELKPNNGKKTDPAHPAIYPTGLAPKELKPREFKLYDLIVKRFMATFAEPAVRETIEAQIDVNTEIFITKGTRTLQENWHIFYKPYVKLEEITLPALAINDKINITEIKQFDKQTEPPNRYNQSSIIKELEKRNLGTKATRADILDRLFQRGYVEGVQIKVSQLGIETTEILEKYIPIIVDEKLTAYFEAEMDKIREGKEKQQKVLDEVKKTLTPIMESLHKKEKQIGQEILKSVKVTRDAQNFIGSCKACPDGTLQMKKGKFGFFIACNKYPECKVTFKIPQGAIVKGLGKTCEKCTYPLVEVRAKAKRPSQHCINPSCETKLLNQAAMQQYAQDQQEKQDAKDALSPSTTVKSKNTDDTTVEKPAKKVTKKTAKKSAATSTSSQATPTAVPNPASITDKTCPKCQKPLLKRRSFYGEFYGCSGFPGCKYTENINPPAPAQPTTTPQSNIQSK